MKRGDSSGLREAPLMHDVCWQPLYDTQIVQPGCTWLEFFWEPVGQGSPAKTYADTNMLIPGGMLPRGWRFYCVGLELRSGAANLEELLSVGYLELRVGTRIILQLGPLSCFYFGRRELRGWWRRWLQHVRAWIDRLLGIRHPSLLEIVPLELREIPFKVVLGFREPLQLSAPIRLTVILGGYLIRVAT